MGDSYWYIVVIPLETVFLATCHNFQWSIQGSYQTI